MHSGEQSQDVYDIYFDSVEHCISQPSNKGPLLVLGDLNVHLGCRGIRENVKHGVVFQDCKEEVLRGNKWIKVIDEHSFITSAPLLHAFRGISNCSTNTSDHVPITCSLSLTHIRAPPMTTIPRIGQQLSKFCCTHKPLTMLLRPLLS